MKPFTLVVFTLTFGILSSAAPRFSPDSERLAYLAKDGERGLVVLDGKAGEPFRNIAATSFISGRAARDPMDRPPQ